MSEHGPIRWFRVIACHADGTNIETALIAAPDAEPNYGATDCEQFGILVGRIATNDWQFDPETDIPAPTTEESR